MSAPDRRIPLIDPRSLTTLGILVVIGLGFHAAYYWKQTSGDTGLDPMLFLSPGNLANLLGQASIVGILACGMTLIIVAGHIDLSVGSLMGMLGGVAALLLSPKFGWSPPVAVLAAIGLGVAIGILHGSLVSGLRLPLPWRENGDGWRLRWFGGHPIPAFVVTLGGFMAYRGVLQIIAGQTIPIRNPEPNTLHPVNLLGTAALPAPWAWGLASLVVLGILAAIVISRRNRRALQLPAEALWIDVLTAVIAAALVFGACYWLNARPGAGIPIRFVALLILAIAVGALAQKFTFGRHVYAIGGNEEAARYSGIRVGLHLIGVFALMGAIAGLAGLVSIGQLGAADSNGGDLMELYAIAACVIGGTSLSGGRGTVTGAVLGALIMATIRNGLSMLGVQNAGEKIVLGVILVLAVGLDLILSRKHS